VREADRPPELRVSIFDRPRLERDTPPMPGPFMLSGRVDESSIRLALEDGAGRVYLARGEDPDRLFSYFTDGLGGGGSGTSRTTIAAHGGTCAWNSNQSGCVAYGIVPDPVIAVRVNGVHARMGHNAFLLEVDRPGGEVIFSTADGDRTLPRPPRPRVLRGPDESTAGPDGKGYDGLVEYAWSGITTLAIDDLDIADWHGAVSTFVTVAGAPEVQPVGVVLLEGPRAGELGMADLITRTVDGEISVEFVGRSAFGPHPDPPRLPEALARVNRFFDRR
jgi:hypothetical protein